MIEPKAEAFEVISNPVQVMHSLESAYGNWLLKFFACWFVQASKPMARCFKVVIGQALAGIEQTNCHICSGVARNWCDHSEMMSAKNSACEKSDKLAQLGFV